MGYSIPLYIKEPSSKEFSASTLKNYPAPSLPRFIQEELTLLAGRDRFGEPRMRIGWGQDLFRIINGQKRLKYSQQTWGDNFGELFDIGTPRFIVEQKIDPVFLDLDLWNCNLQGPTPIKGQYIFLMCIQDEDGSYCTPDIRHITELRAMDFRRRHAKLLGSHEELPPEWETKQKVKDLIYIDKMNKESKHQARRNDIKDFVNERRRRLLSRHPREGRVLDPYKESQKAKEKGIIYGSNI